MAFVVAVGTLCISVGTVDGSVLSDLEKVSSVLWLEFTGRKLLLVVERLSLCLPAVLVMASSPENM